ncbi:MAG: 1-phosphofructokinase family hexose kinase [Propionibacteriaceae bacterium]|nr:1-phosphofructokinase family hexose kinase [Propionibacteriaceae bacterium]
MTVPATGPVTTPGTQSAATTPRIVTITLNAAIDKRLTVDAVVPHTVMRAHTAEYSPGGKGLNVARVAYHLLSPCLPLRQSETEVRSPGFAGESVPSPVVASGFLAGHAGRYIAERLEPGIGQAFVWVAGESRSCVNLIDAAGVSTEFLEPGITVGEPDLLQLETVVAELSGRGTTVVFSGSLPDGCPADTYARLVTVAKREGALTALDTSGEPLRLALAAQPDFIKPNAEEVTQLTGRTPTDPASAAQVAAGLRAETGIAAVALSLGALGAVLAGPDGLWHAAPPPVTAVNTVGCGDAFVAGFVTAWSGGPARLALVQAVEVATAAAMSPTTGSFRAADRDAVRRPGVRLAAMLGSTKEYG